MSTERNVEFIECTKSEYENLSDKKDNTLYFTDDGDLYKGTTAYSENVQSDWNETQSTSGAFIKNKPTSMPASDVKSWAKADNKPTYTYSEVGAAASSHTHDDRYYTESEIDSKLNTKLSTFLKGSANGLAELDSTGKVPSNQLPSFVDDVIEGYLYNGKFYKESSHATEISGESGKIYIDLSTEKTYRWSGSTFVVISETLALGETSSTAYRGDRGKTAYDHSQSTHARTDATKVEASSTNGNIKINSTETTVYTHPSGTNPHGTTKNDVGLGNVGNFKAVSTVANQGLSDTEKANARANIGAGTSSFSGNYNDLTNKPTIPTVGNGTITIKQAGTTKGTFTTNQGGNTTIELTDNNATYGVATSSTPGLVKSGTDITVDSSGNVSVNDDSHNHTQIKYCANISSDDAINNFLEAETFKTAIWTSTSSPGVSNGIILSGGYTNDTYGFQLAIDDDPTYYMALRQKSGNGWNSWKQIPMGDGTGASGTWNINISGNATTATSAGNADTLDGNHASDFATASHTHSNYISNSGANPEHGNGAPIKQPAGEAAISIRTTAGTGKDAGIFYLSQDNAYIANSSDNTYSFGVFDTDLTSDMSNVDEASFVVLSNGEGAKLRGQEIIHSGNIGSQSVNYANSAGSVAWNDVSGKPSSYTPSSHTHEISDVTGLQDALGGKAASSHNHDSVYSKLEHSHNYAGSSSDGGSATSAVSVVDYGNTSKTIKIGFDGAGATTDNLGYIAGYINNGTQIKDVNKDTLKSWLGLGSAAYTNSDAFATSDHTHSNYLTGITKDMVTTALGYTPPTQDTTYGVATTSANGLMSTDMVTKLMGIATNANRIYVQSQTLGQMTLQGNYDGYAPQFLIPNPDSVYPLCITPRSSGSADVCWIDCYIDKSTGKTVVKLKNTVSNNKTFTPSIYIIYQG